MSVTRDIGDYSTAADGDGQEYTSAIRETTKALWAYAAGVLTNVTGTNEITAQIAVSDGFTALTDGLVAYFVPSNTNTGAVTLNVASLGAKSIKTQDNNALSAGDLVSGTLYQIVFVFSQDCFYLLQSTGTTNVTVQGGIHLYRSAPTRLVSLVAESILQESILSRTHSSQAIGNRIVVEGAVSRRNASSGADNVAGFEVSLYADGVQIDSLTDAEYVSAAQTTNFAFEYSSTDVDPHNYEVRVTSSVGASYTASASWMVLSEYSPNA